MNAIGRHRPFGPPVAVQQRGVATLVVVMVLFFVVSMVAAYTSRNLIFEQRTSANQYRATQAFEAAEAGLEWGLAMLNAGRIDAQCLPTTDGAFGSFRQRYAIANVDTGVYSPPPGAALTPTCVRTGAGWDCSCPTAGAPVVAAPEGAGPYPAFRLQIQPTGRPGVVLVQSRGCTSLNEPCLASGRTSAGDSVATVFALAGLARALPTSPVAALTVRGDLDVGGFALRVVNTDAATNGIAVHAGGSVDAPNAQFDSVAGSGESGAVIVDGDASLAALSAERMFQSFLGTSRNTFMRQPAAVVLTCSGDCTATLQDAVTRNPGRPIWINGDLSVGNVDVGSPAAPVLLVVQGNVTLAANTRIYGLVYTQATEWAIAGTGLVQGAVIAEGDVEGVSAPTIVFDPGIVNLLRADYGSFVRVPGSWKDF